MANYLKAFNLRNGVQVDNSNFIVNANGLVGIGSTLPTQTLDVNGSVNISGFATASNLYSGIATVGFLNATGGVSVSGAVTATTFYGSASGLTGIYAIAVPGWYVSSANATISTSYSVGIGTTLPQSNLQIGAGITFNANGNATYAGVITARSFYGSGAGLTALNANNIYNGTINNSLLPSTISVTTLNATNLTGTLTGNITGTASAAQSLIGTPNINVGVVTSTSVNNATFVTTTNINSGFSTTGISTIYTLLNAAAIGVSTNTPNANVHIYQSASPSLQLTSINGFESYITFGNSVTRTGINGELRFGNTNSSYRFSTPSSLDVINYGSGNVNNYLQFGSSGLGTGNFNWIYGQNYNTSLMTLTYGGLLGIGITNPTNTLHVVGTSTVTSNSYVGGNSFVAGSLTVGSVLNANTIILNNINANLTGNVNATSGISTFTNLKVTGNSSLNNVSVSTRLGVGNTNSNYPLQVNSGSIGFLVNSTGGIGLNTDTFTNAPGFLYNVSIDSSQGVGYFQGVGIGTTTPKSFADFSAAGYNVPTLGSVYQFMIPPKLTTAQRNSLTIVEGGLIYNTTSRRLELYNGTAWVGIVTTA